MSGDFSSLELAHFLENRRIGFRSIVHLNRYLFDQHFPSYDKTVNLLKQLIFHCKPERNQLIQNSKASLTSDLFSLQWQSEPQSNKLSPQEMEFLDTLHLSEIQNTPRKNDRYKQLYRHAQVLQAKQQTMPLVREQEDLKRCTFSPLIMRYKPKEDFGDRLSKKKPVQMQQEEEDISECTFKPKLNQRKRLSSQNENVSSIKGVESQVQRYQQARQLKEKQDRFYEEQTEKLRQRNQVQTEAFQLSETPKLAPPIVYLDVKVAKGKTGRLGVRRGDNVDQLVRNFTRTYQLSSISQQKLRRQIEEVLQMFYRSQFD